MEETSTRGVGEAVHVPNAIREAIRAVADSAQALCVILFGSWATGQENAESDVDLVVVCETTDRWRTAGELLCLWNRLRRENEELPDLDILVYTAEEFLEGRRIPGFVPFIAMREGIVVYGEPPATSSAMAQDSTR